MTTLNEKDTADPELDAMVAVYGVLRTLPADAQQRVLNYVAERLGLTHKSEQRSAGIPDQRRQPPVEQGEAGRREGKDDPPDEIEEELAGVSPVAQKWIRRNGLSAKQLSAIFSLGLDDIDVVARSVPGSSKRERMRNVVLLTGAAAYLASGAARANDDALRQALSHYNAYDRSNFATYMREFSADVSGSKESGYTLTARGLAAAADVIKEMTAKA